jgi:hypothetical protein
MESDRDYQTRWLERIVDEGLNAPIFKPNPDFPIARGDGVPRINYNDVMDRCFILRICPIDEVFEPLWTGATSVIKEYQRASELIDDGWRLD